MKLYLKLFFSILLFSGLMFGFAATAAAGDIKITKPVYNTAFSETSDFASRRFADPWDMSEYTDMSYGQYTKQIANYEFKGGMLSGRTTGTDAYFHPLFPGYRAATPLGKDGSINKIPTSLYKSFSVRMYSSQRTTAQLYWFFNNTWTDYGSKTFRVYPGWRTYQVKLRTSSKWKGQPIGLRFDLSYQKGVYFKVDWMRLHSDSARRVRLSWTDSSPGSSVKVYLDRDTTRGNNAMEQIHHRTGQESNTIYWNPSAFKPGSYYFYVKKAGQTGVYSKRVLINRIPLIEILNPDAAGGRDYAQDVSGNRWDMSQSKDIAFTEGFTNVRFSNGIMSGTTLHDDAYMHFRVPRAINTSKYHRLSFRYRYDGAFGFGRGTMSRFIWTPDRWNIKKYSTSDDIVTFPRWRTYTMDLKHLKLDAGTIGWQGLVREFRFDPSEVRGRTRFYLDFVRLAADDTANRGMTIQWRENRTKPRPTRVALYYDTNRSGYNGRLIAGGIREVAGKNSYKWNTSRVPAGKYWVYIKATDGLSAIKRYSTGPVVIRH